MPELGRTALVIPVPEADPALAAVGTRYPRLARPGLPAHLTVLYPWLPAAYVDDRARRSCAALAATAEPAEAEFREIGVHPGMVFLRPADPGPVDRLIAGARTRWPELPPYGGKYPDSPAHVSLALGGMSPEEVDGVRDLVGPMLPITSRLAELWLVALGPDGWLATDRWPLGVLQDTAERR
ncbi:2'-5' RNA ligase family protein [Pseudonocardia eucalypti]|uniref:2'-5' RNA ligase family protein n=1 Tax=Pseudonocardia eucalypti TaxID=648755 RepID=A0ABP9RF81_9PSEU|nr:hypothetical protein [Pseudonocardia eucalypti]